jgi:arylformamidase
LIIEGLNLAPVTAGDFELICLPVKITGCEGALAKAILKKM